MKIANGPENLNHEKIVACMTLCKLIQVAFHGFQSTCWVGFPLHGGERELVIFRSRKLQSSRLDSLGSCLDDVTCNKMLFFFLKTSFCSFFVFFGWLGGRGWWGISEKVLSGTWMNRKPRRQVGFQICRKPSQGDADFRGSRFLVPSGP